MKKIISAVLVLLLIMGLSMGLAACGGQEPEGNADPGTEATTEEEAGGLIKVGIINNPPEESGYRAANVKDFQETFTDTNGYDASFAYSLKFEEQLASFNQFVTDGVDYILLSAAATDGWDSAFETAKEAGIQILLFDRMVSADESLYEAAVVSDMAEEGNTAVAWLTDQKLKEYNVIHIQGVMGSDAQIGRTAALDKEFAAGTMKKVVQQTGNWSDAEAKTIVEAVINAKTPFNVIYAENDNMAQGAAQALDAAGITHGVKGDVVIMGFDCNKWALEELLAGNWNYDGQCSPFQAKVIDGIIKGLQAGTPPAEKKIISEEKGFDATTITQEDVDTYGLG
ncbi:MAG: substrate-binding domain-containing protein [Clostridiales Family XIII bacterium]|jgi:simple sugar transport system substrate-binding protein|nr:substrate-binding domain-containing protein [Clostridiales Family XIII bacterium]